MMKVACLNNIAKVGTNRLGEGYELTTELADADAVLVRSADMKELDLPQSLLAIARAGAGVNNIPLDKCADAGIVVFNTPGANANGVKELVLTGMLLAARDIVGGINWVKANTDDANIAKTVEKQKKNFAGTEIKGKTLGVIGLGAIGAMVAKSALDLGMKVLGYDPYLSVKAAWSVDPAVKLVTDLDDIYAVSDYITIHVPAMESTKGMISAEAIAKMKDGVTFLNYSRDTLVDEAAMAEALKSGHVHRYMSDFANPKSVVMEGAVVTPHLGASTEESEDNCAVMAVDQIKNYIENGNIINSVNFARIDMGAVKKARVAVFHAPCDRIAGKVAGVLADCGFAVSAQVDGIRGNYGYALYDVDHTVCDATVAKIMEVEGVSKVRVIK